MWLWVTNSASSPSSKIKKVSFPHTQGHKVEPFSLHQESIQIKHLYTFHFGLSSNLHIMWCYSFCRKTSREEGDNWINPTLIPLLNTTDSQKDSQWTSNERKKIQIACYNTKCQKSGINISWKEPQSNMLLKCFKMILRPLNFINPICSSNSLAFTHSRM